MQTDLRKIEEFCTKQIDLIHQLLDVKDFPGEVEFCTKRKELTEVHIYEGIELVACALKRPVHINTFSNDGYKKSVTCNGVTFFQLGFAR